VDSVCFEVFLKELGKSYADQQIVMVLDNGPSHLAADIEVPQNITLLSLPSYSPQLNPVERWSLEFKRALANRSFETIEALHEAISRKPSRSTGTLQRNSEGSPVFPGGGKLSIKYALNNSKRY
jgi:transposase